MAFGLLKKTASVIAGIHAANTLIDINVKNMAKRQKISGKYFEWRHGRIFYRVRGQGDPILLIHNLDPKSASFEWDDIISLLSKDHRVFSVDLPGCGRSDKPRSVYTNFFYMQAIKDFTQKVIKASPKVITCLDSAPFVIMANGMYEGLFSKVLLINPCRIDKNSLSTDIFRKTYLRILFTPVIGTAIYNIENMSSLLLLKKSLDLSIDENTISNTENIYISSHLQKNNGRFLHASKLNRYLNADVKNMLCKADNIYLIFSAKIESKKESLASFKRISKNLPVEIIPSKRLYPHRDQALLTYSSLKKLL